MSDQVKKNVLKNTQSGGNIVKKSQGKSKVGQEKLNNKLKGVALAESKVTVFKGKPSVLGDLICAKDSNNFYENYTKFIAKANENKLSISKSRDIKSDIQPFMFDKESPDDKALKSRNRKTNNNIDDLFKKLVV